MTRISLYPGTFTAKEREIVKTDSMTVTGFAYSTGVEAVRIANKRGWLMVLPFQGQQIWRAHFDGHDLWMRTAIDEPINTQDYLRTYGGFLYHCGFRAMGCPAADDDHPQHGELPNAAFGDAALLVTDDAVTLTSARTERIAFVVDYTFRPSITLKADAAVADIHVECRNNRAEPLEYMYLTHINFRPVDGGELVYTAPYDHIKVHRKFPAHMDPAAKKALEDYMDAIEKDPTVHHVFDSKKQIYNPEICMTVMYEPDEDGFGHTMEVLPTGCAFYESHRVDKQPYVIRWLSRTGDEESCGMALPATAEHNGREQARRDGQLKYLPPHGLFETDLKVGLLTACEVKALREKIGK